MLLALWQRPIAWKMRPSISHGKPIIIKTQCDKVLTVCMVFRGGLYTLRLLFFRHCLAEDNDPLNAFFAQGNNISSRCMTSLSNANNFISLEICYGQILIVTCLYDCLAPAHPLHTDMHARTHVYDIIVFPIRLSLQFSRVEFNGHKIYPVPVIQIEYGFSCCVIFPDSSADPGSLRLDSRRSLIFGWWNPGIRTYKRECNKVLVKHHWYVLYSISLKLAMQSSLCYCL